MGLFFVYILKSSVCLAAFYLFYKLLLGKETFHRFNRVFLLGLMYFSFAIPLVKVTVKDTTELGRAFFSMEELLLMNVAEGMAVAGDAVGEATVPWRAALLLMYAVGVVFFIGRYVWSLVQMKAFFRRCREDRIRGGVTLYVHGEKVSPFSWMHSIVISEEDLAENGDAIIAHECAHIQNGHSWDMLLAEVCIIFQWFNPAAWLLKRELQNLHEYEADESVINQGIDAKKYQLLLIKKAVGARLYSIANSFNHSSLKKRITMMIKKKSNPWARLKCLYALPLAAVAVAAFARPKVSNELNEISRAKVNDLTSIVKAEEVKSVEKSSDEKFKLSGVVMEYPSHKPVKGASILVRGTTVGTLADEDGNFSLMVKKGDVLLVSFVGLQTQLVPIDYDASSDDRIKLEIHMKEEVQSMEEMVVEGMSPKSENADVVFDMPLEEPKKPETPQTEEVIFQIVEEMPQFPGGMQEAMKFLVRNVKYPVAAQQARIEGRVIVQFVVEKDGSISNVETVRGVSPELDDEAMRVVNMMPKWIPGKQRGMAVAVKYTMPIMFRLQTPAAPKEDAAPYQEKVTGKTAE